MTVKAIGMRKEGIKKRVVFTQFLVQQMLKSTGAKLRADGITIPIVALTAHAMNEERQRAVQSGFSDFLTKPIDRNNLISLLEKLCFTQKRPLTIH